MSRRAASSIESTLAMKKLAHALWIAICLVTATVSSPMALAAAPMVKTQAPGFYRLMVGDFEVTVLSDGTHPLPALELLRGDASRIAGALHRGFVGEQVETSHNGFLVNTGSKLVLIDPGAGQMLGPSTGALLGNLRAAGYRPEQIDEIYISHMHTDHVGGLVDNGRAVYPHATVRIDRRETDYWLSESNMRAAAPQSRRFFTAAAAAVKPYVETGRLKVFDSSTELIPGVRAVPAYGHTPGHSMFVVESKGQKLLLWGDVVHVAVVQFDDPSVTIGYDVDAAAAARERAQVMADAAANGDLVAGAHLPFPGIGHVRASGTTGFTFVPQNYSALK